MQAIFLIVMKSITAFHRIATYCYACASGSARLSYQADFPFHIPNIFMLYAAAFGSHATRYS
jgi:hypothetical protein